MITELNATDIQELEKLQNQLYNELSHISNLMDEVHTALNNPINIDIQDLKFKLIAKVTALNRPTIKLKRCCKCCGKEVNGRKDKIYCTVSCKTNYHAVLNREVLKVAAKTNSQLRRNHSILLDKTILEGKTKVAQIELEVVGFNFDFHTGLYRDKTTKTRNIRIYDFILSKVEPGIFEIEKLSQPTIYTRSNPLKNVKITKEAKSFINKRFLNYLQNT